MTNPNDYLELLVKAGALTHEDRDRLESEEVEHVLQVLAMRNQISPNEVIKAREILTLLRSNQNGRKRQNAKIALITIMNSSMSRKMKRANERLRASGRRITQTTQAVLAVEPLGD